ncbi:hypothetical protein [Nocardia transvalensis]|uniref:hypothetical protein n=1 Tax=Nocardia transvalensis TaxID=37333 RepID=UPI001892D442|nr:hypothetical protein [Nocardia transvalensis]MBF6333511.1 hypothetical protein [Nocardia transvalensis]
MTDNADLFSYAERVLADTGITPAQVPQLTAADAAQSAAAEALRAGWQAATRPIPDLPAAEEATAQ